MIQGATLKPSLPALLSLTAGFVDTAGFMALQGLFTAHVTGNFVTLGSSLVLARSGTLAKILALPVFCIVILVTRLMSYGFSSRGLPMLRTIITIKVGLLVAAAVLAIRFGPFLNGDTWPALATGLTLVAAMAIQNAAHRIHLANAPPTTVMTGTTTQIMIDLADLLHGRTADAVKGARLWRMTANLIGFAGGCAAAALAFTFVGVWCFLVPPVLGASTLLYGLSEFPGDIR